MKKIVILSLCVIAILAVPFGIGFITQQRSEILTAHYRSNPTIHAIEDSFQRGWFHSDALSKITLYLPEISDKNIDILVHQSVRQGPVLWGDNRPLAFGFADVKIDIELSANMQNELTQAFGRSISLLSLVHYDGSQVTTLSIPELTHHDDVEQMTINTLPLDLKFSSTPLMDQISGLLKSQGIKFRGIKAGEQVNISLGKNISHFNVQKENSIWTGNMDWKADEFQILGKAHELKLTNFMFDGHTNIDTEQRISSSSNFSFERFYKDSIIYGPAQFDIAVNHIPLSVFEKINSIKKQITALPEEQRQQAMKNMGFSMFSLLPDILAAEPEIKIHDASLTTPDGDIKGELYFTITGLNKQDVMNFTKIKKHIRADMQVQLPWALVSDAKKANIESLLQKGWLLEQGDMLHSTLHMADGVLTINDQTIPLPF